MTLWGLGQVLILVGLLGAAQAGGYMACVAATSDVVSLLCIEPSICIHI